MVNPNINLIVLGENPLILACMRGWSNYYKKVKGINAKSKRCKIVEAFLKNGSSLEIFESGDSNPLHWACYHGDYSLSKVN